MNGNIQGTDNEFATVGIPQDNYYIPPFEDDRMKKRIIDFVGSFDNPYQDTTIDLTSAIDILLIKASSKETIGKAGERIYSAKRSELEKKYFGKFAVIDTDSEEIIAIESTPVEAMLKAKKKKGKQCFLIQIGIKTLIN